MKKKSRKITFDCPRNLADHLIDKAKAEGVTLTRRVVEDLEKAENIVAEYVPNRTGGRSLKKSRTRKAIKPESKP